MQPCFVGSKGLYAPTEAAAPAGPPSTATEAMDYCIRKEKTDVLTCNLVSLTKGCVRLLAPLQICGFEENISFESSASR